MKNRLSLLVLMLTFICLAASGQKNNNMPQSTTPTEISLQDSIQSLRADNADLRKQLDRMEKEVDRYSEYVKTNTSSIENKITWWLGILTAIITIVVGGLGVVAPYLLNRRSGINANKAKTQAEKALRALETAQNDLSTIKKQADNARSQAIDAAAEVTIAKNSLSQISTKVETAKDNATNAAKKAKAIQFFIQALQENDPDKAICLYTDCITQDSDFAEAYNNRGYLRYRKGEIDDAKKDFEDAIAKKDNYAEALNNLGVLLLSQKNFDDANEKYDDAEDNFNRAGEYAEAKLNLGLLKYVKGDNYGAKDYFDKAIELKPNFADAYYIKGLYYLDYWYLGNGIEDIIKAKDYIPNVIEAYPNRNLLTRDMKEWDNSFNGVEYSRDFKILIRVPKDKEGIFKIPDSVTEIGDSAFEDCSNLTSIEIPNSVTVIGKGAFMDCKNLTSIEIPNSVTVIGNGTFEGCTGLTSIEIPNSVTEIGNYAFGRCKGINKYEVSDNNQNYCSIDGALYSKDKAKLIRVPCDRDCFEIPDSVTEIGNGAFDCCTRLTSIKNLYNVTVIGECAFYGCTSLSSIVIPNRVTEIRNGAFDGCKDLISIVIPNSVTEIGASAFEGCTSLSSIVIPNSVTQIGDFAFWGCTSLTSIVIPDSVTQIGWNAFVGCSSLTKIHLKHTSPVDFSDAFKYLDVSKITVYVPKGSIEKYRNHKFYKRFNVEADKE